VFVQYIGYNTAAHDVVNGTIHVGEIKKQQRKLKERHLEQYMHLGFPPGFPSAHLFTSKEESN
jgi:hypothetical protein